MCARSVLVNVVTDLSGYKHIFHEGTLTKADKRFLQKCTERIDSTESDRLQERYLGWWKS